MDLSQDYEKRKRMLLKNNIALWDVVRSCKRAGSADSAIKNAKYNNLKKFLLLHPKIKKAFCNGQISYKLIEKAKLPVNMNVEALPSTSPAFTKPLSWKIRRWKQEIKKL